MKVVNHSITPSELEDRQILHLTNGIREIETAIWGTDERILRTLSHVKKENLLATLEIELARHCKDKEENIIKVLYPTQELRNALASRELSLEKDAICSAIAADRSMPQIQAIRDHHQWTRDRTFPAFSRLPSELRLQIWGEVWSSIPRVHTIGVKNSRFVSNQSPSILLRICQESRSFYLDFTNETFAFNSYINFNIDIIYLRGTLPAPSSGREFLLRFLACSDIRKCEKFAVQKDLLFQESGWFRSLIEEMQIQMPRLTGLEVVAEDDRIMDHAFRDKSVQFVRASRSFIGMSHTIRNSFAYIKDSLPMQFTYRIAKVDRDSIGVYTQKEDEQEEDIQQEGGPEVDGGAGV